MKMGKKKIMLLLACLLSGLWGCAGEPASEAERLPVLAPEAELRVVSSKTQVPEFVEMAGFPSDYDVEACYNITPDFISENSDFAVFKDDTFTESFIVYEGEVYSIGTCFGGFGITGMALGDLNGDGQYELYYTFSWGSGLHNAQIGYFDPVCREVTVFDYVLGQDMMLTVNGAGELCVYKADMELNSFVDYSMEAEEFLGRIVFAEGEIGLDFE